MHLAWAIKIIKYIFTNSHIYVNIFTIGGGRAYLGCVRPFVVQKIKKGRTNMKKSFKKFVSLVVVMCLVVTAVPVYAFADEICREVLSIELFLVFERIMSLCKGHGT